MDYLSQFLYIYEVLEPSCKLVGYSIRVPGEDEIIIEEANYQRAKFTRDLVLEQHHKRLTGEMPQRPSKPELTG